MGSIVIAVLLASASTAGAEVRTAELQVNGMTCPFCAFGIEKKLRDVEGVEEVEVRLDEGSLRLRLRKGNGASIRDLAQAVEKAGFELAALQLEVRGTLERHGRDSWIVVHADLRIRLLEPDGEGGTRPLSSDLRERLLRDDEGANRVIGRVLDPAAEQPALVVAPTPPAAEDEERPE